MNSLPLHLQLPSMSGQLCLSIGKLCKSIGHSDLIVSLLEDENQFSPLLRKWIVAKSNSRILKFHEIATA